MKWLLKRLSSHCFLDTEGLLEVTIKNSMQRGPLQRRSVSLVVINTCDYLRIASPPILP